MHMSMSMPYACAPTGGREVIHLTYISCAIFSFSHPVFCAISVPSSPPCIRGGSHMQHGNVTWQAAARGRVCAPACALAAPPERARTRDLLIIRRVTGALTPAFCHRLRTMRVSRLLHLYFAFVFYSITAFAFTVAGTRRVTVATVSCALSPLDAYRIARFRDAPCTCTPRNRHTGLHSCRTDFAFAHFRTYLPLERFTFTACGERGRANASRGTRNQTPPYHRHTLLPPSPLCAG